MIVYSLVKEILKILSFIHSHAILDIFDFVVFELDEI